MEKYIESCNSCWMKGFKNTKQRSICCASCELKYHLQELFSPLSELLLIKVPVKVITIVTLLIKRILK